MIRTIYDLTDKLRLKEKEIAVFEKKELIAYEDIRRFFPTKYYDFSNAVEPSEEVNGQNVAIKGILKRVETDYGRDMVKARLYAENNAIVYLVFFHSTWLASFLKLYQNYEVVAIGKFTCNGGYFNMANAEVKPIGEMVFGIKPVYSSVSGLKDYRLRKIIEEVIAEKEEDYLPKEIVDKYNLPSLGDSLTELHNPTSMDNIKLARKRMLFDDLLYFATKIEEDNRHVTDKSKFKVKSRKKMDEYISGLPYALTNAQRETIDKLFSLIKDGKCVNALIQGDVGCGKTTVAIALMVLLSEAGYQSVLMAPTVTLANQHCEEVKGVCERLGLKVAFYGSSLTAKQREEIKKEVSEGKVDFVVGTQGVINLTFKNLALVIADEEHKYGVEQREKLVKNGTHLVTMSATPIPRSIATTIYGEKKDIYTINELPSNRLPIKTCSQTNDKNVFPFIKKEINNGHQVYVVCPLIEESKAFDNVCNANDVYETYKKAFPNVNVELVTGKTKKKDSEEIMGRFKRNETQILIATSVIEVGISVSNATVITIYNAERFGIAELHQLRGRVGRGDLQSYCILITEDAGNVRVNKLCETTNGFEIAEADLENRGAGDLFGLVQSGKFKLFELALKYPRQYAFCKKVAKELIDNYDYENFLAEYEFRNNYSQEPRKMQILSANVIEESIS